MALVAMPDVNTLGSGHGAGGSSSARPMIVRSVQAGERVGHRSIVRPRSMSMEAFLVSTGLVALAEIGDKTQLLSLVLAARFRKPLPIVLGILAATLLNHAGAGAIGAWVSNLVSEQWMTRILGASFLAMAAWILVPDKLEAGDAATARKGGVFLTTAVLFFIAEMGDKTQVATVMLAARYEALAAVVLGTTAGMMLANAPVVYFGDAIARRIPLGVIRKVTAAAFAVLGIAAFAAA